MSLIYITEVSGGAEPASPAGLKWLERAKKGDRPGIFIVVQE